MMTIVEGLSSCVKVDRQLIYLKGGFSGGGGSGGSQSWSGLYKFILYPLTWRNSSWIKLS